MSIKEFKNRFEIDKNVLQQLKNTTNEMCLTVNKNNNSLVYKVNFLSNVVTYICKF